MLPRPALRTAVLHLAGVLLFLSVPLLMAPGADWQHPWALHPGRSRDLFGYGCAIAYFYFNYYLFIPRLYFRRQAGLFILVTVACFGAVTALPVWIFPFADDSGGFGPPGMQQPPGILRHIEHNLFRFAIVAVLSLLLRVVRRWRETEAARRDAELATLRAQLDPHFLFNSLNTVYALAVVGSEETAPALARLSNMMRYLLRETGQETVALDREVGHLRDYIDLQRLRFGATAALDVFLDEPPPGLHIAPQMLLPAVENAFKYGVNPELPSPVSIHLQFEGRRLQLRVRNRKVAVPADGDRLGLGLRHTRTRLEGLYAGRHQLHVTEDPEAFTFLLELDL